MKIIEKFKINIIHKKQNYKKKIKIITILSRFLKKNFFLLYNC